MAGRGVLLTGCVAGSVLLHLGALLSGTAPVAAPAGGGSGSTSGHAVASIRLEPSHGLLRTTAAHQETPQIQAHAVHVHASQQTTRPATPPAQLLPDLDQLPPTGAGPGTPAGDPDADYVPSRLLTRGPVPQQSIDLLYPELAPAGHFRAVLTLYIDDQGAVRRVRIDEAGDSGLPPALEETARQTFLRSAFAPGELDGRPMRSQLRIEVEFATEPRDADTQTAAR